MSIHMVPREQLELIADRIRAGNAAGEITGLAACAFAGGFSHGMEQGGIKVCGHLELPDLALGADVSIQKWPVVVAPLNDVYEKNKQHRNDPTTWMNAIQYLRDNDALPRVFYANPPCAAYAKQGRRGGINDEDNMKYTRYCIHTAMELQPDVWMWELVPGIYEDTGGGGRQWIDAKAKEAQEAGYEVHYFLTSAAYHGGFQNRPRFHFVATKVGLDWAGVYDDDLPAYKGYRSLGECLDALERYVAENGTVPNHEKEERLAGGSLLSIVPYCPPGGYLRDVCDEIMEQHYTPRGRPWDGKSRAGVTQVRGRRDRTSPVIVGGQTVIHPDRDRFLTIRENASVMGFPYDWRFSHGSKGYQEVGKGLCTHNARFLGLTVATALRKHDAGNSTAPDVSEIKITDWRGLVSVPSQTSTAEERTEWWKKRHPNLPVEYAQPRPKGKVGRPVGYSPKTGTRRRVHSGPKSVMFLYADDELQAVLTKMEFDVKPPKEDEELPATLGRAGISNCIVIKGPLWKNRYYMFMGAALAQGTRVVFYGFDSYPDSMVEHESIIRAGSSDPKKIGPLIAQALGMSAEDVLSKMLEGQDAAALLAKLLGAA